MAGTIVTPEARIKADTSEAKLGKVGMALVSRLAEIRAINKAARDVKPESKTIQEKLFKLGGGAKYLTFMGVKALTRIDSHSTIVDTEKLQRDFPEAFAACATVEPYSYYK